MAPDFTSPYRPGAHDMTAAILLHSAGGPAVSPSSICLSIAGTLASLPSLRAPSALPLGCRYPARNKYYVPGVKDAVDVLQRERQIKHVVLVGWNFDLVSAFMFGGQDAG